MSRPFFARFAAFAVAYNLAVILFGAWVRITGSGAGCGEHWPMCNGEVIPRAPRLATVIEFTHRTTSGLSLVIVVVLVVFAFRLFERGHRVRKAAAALLVFILLEAAVGAGLVLFRLVENDASAARAVVIAFHLVNTLGLLASAFLAFYWAKDQPRGALEPRLRTLFTVAVLAVVLTGATGAITALGDTLFPVGTAHDETHFLVQLRIVHPFVAVAVAIYLTVVARIAASRPTPFVIAAVHTQVLLGIGNILLKAPGYMQLVHLLVANLLWIAVVWLIADRSSTATG